MVLVTRSNVDEDSQNRQLRVSKKLSKAISSVPRSRFQKPRPNLPGSKRTESNVPSTARKTNETSQNTNSIKTEYSSINSESPQKDNTLGNATTSKTEDIIISEEIVNKAENIKTDEALPNIDTQKTPGKLIADKISENNDTTKASEDIITNKKSENDDSPKISTTSNTQEKSHNADKSKKFLNAEEISHNADKSKKSLNADEKSHNADKPKKSLNADEKSHNADKSKKSLNAEKTTQYNPPEISGNLNELIEEISHSDDTGNSISTNNESVQDISGEKTPTLEVPDSVDIPPITTPNSTEKSFKYPHLISILSKKRAEPKKEVQHKKRKKFKKGDVAPERSKMTMADLIYWNPTNSDPPTKSAVTEYEIPSNSNVDEPEECLDADAPVEENAVCDSVPKLVIAEDGSINIDQSSLVVSRNITEPTTTEVIRKDDTTYSSFRKRPMTKHWTAKDTTVFYKALSLVGTDFGLMETIFPERTRRELKLKFKREEKFNIDLINRAMYESHLTFDANTLGDLIKNLNDLTGDFSSENGQEETQSPTKEKKKSTNRKRKMTKAAKSVESDVSDAVTESGLDDVTVTKSDKVKTKRRRKAKKLPEDFVDTDEIDDDVLMEEVSPETEDNDASQDLKTEITSERNLSKGKGHKSQTKALTPSSNETCDTTNIEILCIDDVVDGMNTGLEGGEAIFVPENTSDLSEVIAVQDSSSGNTSQTISLARDNEQEQCITLEYVDVNEAGDLTLLNNVMAFEVVASNTPIPKRRRKINFAPKLPKKDTLKTPCQPLKLSSTNYTPV